MDQMNEMPKARVQVAHPYLALMGLYLAGFTGMYSETALNIALPQLSAAFGVDSALTQWMVVGYMLVIGLCMPFSSLLLKWASARKLTIFALGAFIVGSLISGFANDFAVALVGRCIQGVGTGIVLPLMFSMVMQVIPPHKLGAAMGVTALVIMFAPAVGPTLAGILMGALSWRWIFFSFVIVLAVGMVFAVKFEVNAFEVTRPHVDVLSVLLSCAGFGLVVFGAGSASSFGWLSVPVLASLVLGALCLVAYGRRQMGMSVPIINMDVFKVRGFRIGTLLMIVNFGITLSAMYILPQFYQNAMLVPVAVTGMLLLPGGIVNALVSMVAGRLYDKMGARMLSLAGFALSVVAAGMFLTVTPATPLAFVIAAHVVMMVGVPLAMSPVQTHGLAALPARLSTDGTTVQNTLQQVGGAICTAVATSLLMAGQGASGVADVSLAFSNGSHWVFLLVFALAVVGLLVSFRLSDPRRTVRDVDSATAAQAA